MKVVIDTNVIISSIGKFSPNRELFDAILNRQLEVYITNDILFEYREILERKTNEEVANNFSNLLNMLLNVHFINVFYKWNLIDADPDDNKFIDCYVASNTDFLITNDKHFELVKSIEFPMINIIGSQEIIENYL